jgi:FtsH-binding integral membrane protein
MTSKIYQLFEYAYLVMAGLSIYAVYSYWGEERGRAYMFIFFAIVAVLMFFFKRRFRKMVEKRYTDDGKK